MRRSFAEAYEVADVVILVTAAESTRGNGEPELIKLNIKESFKESYSNYSVSSASSDSSKDETVYLLQSAFNKTPLEKNKDYVIFGKYSEHKIITSNACKGSFSYNYVKAKQDIEKLRKLKDAIKRFKKP